MDAKQIQSIRRKLSENTAKFGKRFFCSPRTVESWEQGRHEPSALALRMLERLRKRVDSD